MEKWFVSMKKADFTQIAEKYHISPIIARLIRNRDILGDQNIDYYLNGTIADLHDGMLMKNMDICKPANPRQIHFIIVCDTSSP